MVLGHSFVCSNNSRTFKWRPGTEPDTRAHQWRCGEKVCEASLCSCVWKSYSVCCCAGACWQARRYWPFWLQGHGAALCLPGVRRHGCAGQANYTSVTLSSSLRWLETSYYTAGWIMYRMITFSSLYGSSSLANRATDTEPPHTVSALISTCLVFPQCSTPTPLILLVLINVLWGQLK